MVRITQQSNGSSRDLLKRLAQWTTGKPQDDPWPEASSSIYSHVGAQCGCACQVEDQTFELHANKMLKLSYLNKVPVRLISAIVGSGRQGYLYRGLFLVKHCSLVVSGASGAYDLRMMTIRVAHSGLHQASRMSPGDFKTERSAAATRNTNYTLLGNVCMHEVPWHSGISARMLLKDLKLARLTLCDGVNHSTLALLYPLHH